MYVKVDNLLLLSVDHCNQISLAKSDPIKRRLL